MALFLSLKFSSRSESYKNLIACAICFAVSYLHFHWKPLTRSISGMKIAQSRDLRLVSCRDTAKDSQYTYVQNLPFWGNLNKSCCINRTPACQSIHVITGNIATRGNWNYHRFTLVNAYSYNDLLTILNCCCKVLISTLLLDVSRGR